jgi:pyruvate dehydrogenase E1 component
MGWALRAQELLAQDWGVAAEVWSATSWTELRRDAVECEEWNLMHPDAEARVPFVTKQLADVSGPVVAVSDFMRAVQDLISRWVPTDYTSLGHGRLRPLRHPARAAPALPRRRGVDRGGDAARAGPPGRGAGGAPADAFRKYAIDDVSAAPVGETGGDT